MEEQNKEITCPACGSSDFEVFSIERTVTEPYGEPVNASIDVYKCRVCGMEGDFPGHEDELIEKAIEDAKHNSIVRIIEEFARNDISMSSIERALDLPQRTLTKWKNGLSVPAAAGVALMNIIRTYPWLLTVAQYKYDPCVARQVHITNAVNELLKIAPLGYGNMPVETGVCVTPDWLGLYKIYGRTDEGDIPVDIRVAIENTQGSYFIQKQDVQITGV